MEITGTREAFMALIRQPGFAKRFGINKSLVSQWASGDRVPTIDKMEEVLLRFGCKVVIEKVWDVLPEKTLRHKVTGNVGLFLKEYKPTGKPLTTQIAMNNGLTFYAPSIEFEEYAA